jgi:hypothetical protein
MSGQAIIWNVEDPRFESLLRLAPESEVRHILNRGFPDSVRITISPLQGSDPEIPRISVAEQNDEPVGTVEFFRSREAKRPLANYAKHAAGVLGPKRLRHVTGPTATAIIYDAGIPLSHELSDLFRRGDSSAATQILARVLERLVPWDLGEKRLQDIAPYHAWLKDLGDLDAIRHNWRAVSRDLDDDIVRASASSVARVLHHASDWRAETFSTLLHGDLHADNILINPNDQLVFVDFANTGRGHFLWDLARLESDLMMRVMPQAFGSAFWDALATPHHSSILNTVTSKPRSQEFFCIFAKGIQRSIRRAAWSRMEHRSEFIPEYYLALFCNTVKVVFQAGPDVSTKERWLAAFTCSQMARNFEFRKTGIRYHFVSGNRDISSRFIDEPSLLVPDLGDDVDSETAPQSQEGNSWEEHASVRALLSEAVDLITLAHEKLTSEDVIAADTEVLKASTILNRLYQKRSIGEGFGLVISSLRNAVSLSRVEPLTPYQTQVLLKVLRDIRDRPEINFADAARHVRVLRSQGLQVQPVGFDRLAEWLNAQSLR